MVFSFLQILGATCSAYGIPWPSGLQASLSFFRLFLFTFVESAALSCWNADVNFYFNYYFVVFSWVIFVFLCSLVYAFSYFSQAILTELQSKLVRIASLNFIVRFSTLAYPVICYHVMSLWNCVYIGNQYYLIADYSILCSGSFYSSTSVLNGFVMVLYVLGWPALTIVSAYFVRNKLVNEEIQSSLVHLHVHYDTAYWFWDAVDLVYKFYLTGLFLYFEHGSSVCTFLLFFQIRFKLE